MFNTSFFSGIKLAVKNNFFFTSTIFLTLLIGSAFLASLFSGRQPATVGLDVGLSVARFALPLLVILLCQQVIFKEFEGRYYLASFSSPGSRTQWLLGRIASVVVMTLGLMVFMLVGLAALINNIASGYQQSTSVDLSFCYVLVGLLMALDLFVIVSMAVLISVCARTSAFVLLGVFGFLIIARSYSSVIDLLIHGDGVVPSQLVYKESFSLLMLFLPDLGALDVRGVALYGQLDLLPDDLWLAVLAASVYGVALISMSCLIIRNKRFS